MSFSTAITYFYKVTKINIDSLSWPCGHLHEAIKSLIIQSLRPENGPSHLKSFIDKWRKLLTVVQSMTCYLFWVAAPATPQPKIPPHLQPRATCFFDGRNLQAQPQLYQILVLIFILSTIKLVKNGFFGSKFALNC